MKTTSNYKVSCFFCKKRGHLKKDYLKHKRWKAKQEKENKGSEDKANFCFMVNSANSIKRQWLIDSGASSHMVYSRDFFKSFQPLESTVSLARNDITAKALWTDRGVIKCLNEKGNPVDITLTDVLYIPTITNNLISVRRITKNGHKVLFFGPTCKIISNERIIAIAMKCGNNLYKMITEVTASIASMEDHHNEDCLHKWHRRFGHRNIESIRARLMANA